MTLGAIVFMIVSFLALVISWTGCCADITWMQVLGPCMGAAVLIAIPFYCILVLA